MGIVFIYNPSSRRLGTLLTDPRVVALGYEPTYGPERRLAQNAVYVFHPLVVGEY